jgi:hypothetical protein
MNDRTIVEVNGIKLDVDMRTAKRIDVLRVGSRVKILNKPGYGDTKVYAGVVIGFEPFPTKPSILVAYMATDYSKAEIKIVAINSDTKDYEMVASIDDELFSRDEVLKQFDRQINVKQREVSELLEQRRYFETNFSAYWTKVEA